MDVADAPNISSNDISADSTVPTVDVESSTALGSKFGLLRRVFFLCHKWEHCI